MATSPDSSLELTGEQLRDLVDLAVERIVPYINSLPEQPVTNLAKAKETAEKVFEGIPTSPTTPSELLDLLFDEYIPVGYNPASPGYLAYVPGGGLPHTAVADLIADAVNRYVGVWIAAPALAQLEAVVVRWFCEIIGYPKQSGGFLTSGGSLANLTAIVTARRCRLPDDFLKARIYTSNQAHHSVEKAAMLAGFPTTGLQPIETDERFRIQIDALRLQIEKDRKSGLLPFAIVGHAGTTNTGAVDDLEELATLAGHENLWLHVDAAYGGFFMLTKRGKQIMKGIERADSVTLDPHKGLFLPYGTGCLLVRNVEHLRQTHAVSADYMPAKQESTEFVDFCDISPELSRDFRGLRVWLPIKMHGIGVFRENLDEKIDLAHWVADELRKMNDEISDKLRIVAEPQLSTVVFRLERAGLNLDESNQLNKHLRDKINAKRRVFLTPTILEQKYAIRICIVSFRTHRDRVQECIEAIRGAIGEL